MLSLRTVHRVGGVKGSLIFHAPGMGRKFADHAGPDGAAKPSETYAMLRIARERVMRGEPTFRSREYAGSTLTCGERGPLETAVRAATGRKLQK